MTKRTIALHDHEAARITQGLRILAGYADKDAELARDLGFDVTAADHDDEAAACRLLITRINETQEA